MNRRNVFGAAAIALVLGVPAFAQDPLRNDPARAAQRIESARTALEAASRSEGPKVEGRVTPRELYVQRASEALQIATTAYEAGHYRVAQFHAEKAARLVWKASEPRKGDK